MKRLLKIAILILFFPLFSYAENCQDKNTLYEIRQCTGKAYQKSEKGMAEKLKKLSTLLAPNQKAVLKAAQSAWLVYQEKHCTLLVMSNEGGTMAALVQVECRLDLTQRRNKDLATAITQYTPL